MPNLIDLVLYLYVLFVDDLVLLSALFLQSRNMLPKNKIKLFTVGVLHIIRIDIQIYRFRTVYIRGSGWYWKWIKLDHAHKVVLLQIAQSPRKFPSVLYPRSCTHESWKDITGTRTYSNLYPSRTVNYNKNNAILWIVSHNGKTCGVSKLWKMETVFFKECVFVLYRNPF